MSLDATSIMTGSAKVKRLNVGGFRVTDVSFPSRLHLPSHYHEQACCAIVLEGAVDKGFSRHSYETPASTVVTMPPAERHVDQFSHFGARILVIEPEQMDEELLRPCQDVFQNIYHFQDEVVTRTAWRIAAELQVKDQVSSLVINGLVLEMIALVTRHGSFVQSGKDAPVWLLQARDIVQAHFVESLRVADIAERVGVHPVHLARVFRQQYGMTMGSFVRQLRLEWATTQLMKSANLPLSQIASKAGFADQSHFSRLFKAYKGITPSQFRKLFHS